MKKSPSLKVWKAIPAWFRIENYELSANFRASEWYIEIINRLYDLNSDNHRLSLEYIKNQTFFSKEKNSEYIWPEYLTGADVLEEKIQDIKRISSKAFSVRNLNRFTAYNFFMNLKNKKEIEKELGCFDGSKIDMTYLGRKKRRIIYDKYQDTIAKEYNTDQNGVDYGQKDAFLVIDLNASDQQILKDFKDWLIQTRSEQEFEFIKQELTSNDFQDWHDSRVLPYWDLTNVARSESAIIPNYVLGAALFPNEYDVDLAERVRKVVKRKCEYIFSPLVLDVLDCQKSKEFYEEVKNTMNKTE